MQKIAGLIALVITITGCDKPEITSANEPVGRYQIVINRHKVDGDPPEGDSAEAFLIDSAKGRVWAFQREYIGMNYYDKVPMRFVRIDILDQEGVLGPPSSQFFDTNKKANKMMQRMHLKKVIENTAASEDVRRKARETLEKLIAEETTGTPE